MKEARFEPRPDGKFINARTGEELALPQWSNNGHSFHRGRGADCEAFCRRCGKSLIDCESRCEKENEPIDCHMFS